MKIGIVLDTTLDSDAGVQQYFKGLARYLLSRGVDIRFLVPPSKETPEFKGKIITFGREIVVKGNANTVPTLLNLGNKQIKETLKREKFDIIHISAPFSPFLGSKIIKHCNCRVVSSYMIFGKSKLFQEAVGVLKFLMGNEYKKIDVHLAPSTEAKKEAEKTIPGDYRILPLAVDLQNFNANVKVKKYDDKKVNILTIGRLEERKGVQYLIRAFEKVKKSRPDTRLIICGSGPKELELKEIARNLNIKDINFEGYISEEKKSEYLNTADICVYPAIYGESFGIALVEALAAGKTTIAYANEGYKFVLRNLPELLVDPKNINSLANTILKFVRDDKLRIEYDKKCKELSYQYSWDIIGKKVLNIYKELLSVKEK